MPKEILCVRGRLRNAFPGLGVTKTLIREAYAKAGWDINELSVLTKKQVQESDVVAVIIILMLSTETCSKRG